MHTSWLVTKLHNVEGDDAQISGLAVDNEGNVYFTVFLEGLFRLSKDQKLECLVRDETLGGAEMSGVVLGKNNVIYSCDLNNHKIVSYSIETAQLNIVAGCGEEGKKDGTADEAMFRFPEALAVDEEDNLYIAEYRSVRMIDTKQRTVETFAELRPLTFSRKFDRLAGLAVKDGIVYGADYFNHCIRQIKNGVVSIVAGAYGKEGNFSRRLTDSQFSCPHGLAMYQDGSLLVADKNGIRRVDIAGNRVWTILPDHANVRELSSLATNQKGDIYVATTDSIYKLENTWKWERMLWLGHMKGDRKSCMLARLPKNLVAMIACKIRKESPCYEPEEQPTKKAKHF